MPNPKSDAWYMKKPKAPKPASTETAPETPPEAPSVEPEAVEVVPQPRRCGKCGRNWSPPAPDTCPECGGKTNEE